MTTTTLYCGIDISAETFDICVQNDDGNFVHHQLPNNANGFKQLLQICATNYHFVMETTGNFQLPLCFYLHEKNRNYSVVNALQIKRYIQMNLERSKSDKKDAKHICMYGIERNPQQYKMPCQQYFECKQLNNAIESLTREVTAFTNKSALSPPSVNPFFIISSLIAATILSAFSWLTLPVVLRL